ncbi:hypothetical protein FN846DRAFT_913870 [Sphaerosporella brunnea]|uniref:Uncharacterized protein n=1 Tax=Sphaerosporella brunnea TaxID=1250544 RepID=A0A5J5EE25_9PEZI|nr:hypothetical protein FN846DRAFT_913870 [Sphaerosporella brunnea]
MASIAFASTFFLSLSMVLASRNPVSNLFGRAIQTSLRPTARTLLHTLEGMAENVDVAVKRYIFTFDNMVERLIACSYLLVLLITLIVAAFVKKPTLAHWPGRVWWLCYSLVCAGIGLVTNRPEFAAVGLTLALFFELMARAENGNGDGNGNGDAKTGDAAAAVRRASASF